MTFQDIGLEVLGMTDEQIDRIVNYYFTGQYVPIYHLSQKCLNLSLITQINVLKKADVCIHFRCSDMKSFFVQETWERIIISILLYRKSE